MKALVILCLVLAGCSHVSLPDDDNNIREFAVPFFERELTVDAAIQIALFQNPKIQAAFEDIGIARADLIEAGLLANPYFSIEIRFPSNIEYLFVTSLLDLFLIPLRTKLAEVELEQVKLKVSNTILNLAFEVRETYYDLTAEKNKQFHLESLVEMASISRELAARQRDAGNINALDDQLAEAALVQSELDLLESETKGIQLREKLNGLLGFPGEVCFDTIFPALNIQEFELASLEEFALEERLELQIARFEIMRICKKMQLKEGWTYTNLMGGLAGEKEPDGAHLIGPGFSGNIPLFNFGQAARLRLCAELRQANARLAELEIRVRAEVRSAYKTQNSYLKMINAYQNGMMPKHAEIVEYSEKLYNVMGLGIDKLLESKRQEIVLQVHYLETIKKYLIATVELDRALGGYICLYLE